MPRFNTINFYQNRPKIKLFFPKKIQNFHALEARLLDPRNSPTFANFWQRACLKETIFTATNLPSVESLVTSTVTWDYVVKKWSVPLCQQVHV